MDLTLRQTKAAGGGKNIQPLDTLPGRAASTAQSLQNPSDLAGGTAALVLFPPAFRRQEFLSLCLFVCLFLLLLQL